MRTLGFSKLATFRLCMAEIVIFAALLCKVVQSRGVAGIGESAQRFSSLPVYLPVNFRVQKAASSFFLKEANQEIMRNSSLQFRMEPFFINEAKNPPVINASYGPYTVEQVVPRALLQPSDTFSMVDKFTFNWKIKANIIDDKVYSNRPIVQILFYITGRDWDDYGIHDNLPCIRVYAFRETREVRNSCRLQGDLGLCIVELELLPSWFNPSTVVPGRKRITDQSEGTPVELYYLVQDTDEDGDCDAEDVRKGNAIRPGREDADETLHSLHRIGSVRLRQGSGDPLRTEMRLDNNVIISVLQRPVKQGEVVTFYVSLASSSPVNQFTLR